MSAAITALASSWPLLLAASVAALAVWSFQRARHARRLKTFAAVVSAFREGDYSVRVRARRTDPLSAEVLAELNALGDSLRTHRLEALEAWALLRKVMAEIDAVVIGFDEERRLRLANDAAARALGKPVHELLGVAAEAAGLSSLLQGDTPRVVRDVRALGGGPLELRRGAFRLAGQVHTLVVLSDMSRALREQERDAWKRLIRVIGHEINNSLAPIESIAENVGSILASDAREEDFREDVKSGLAVIGRRASGLSRFMAAYARLARLPPPRLARMDVGAWVRRVATLDQRLEVRVEAGPEVSLEGDADQLDQLLINLVKNAVDASLETGGEVSVRWSSSRDEVEVVVRDGGRGLSDTKNLFVPFFTTKPGGSGIGLALSREIAESHGGRVSLENREDGPGARAVVALPRRESALGGGESSLGRRV